MQNGLDKSKKGRDQVPSWSHLYPQGLQIQEADRGKNSPRSEFPLVHFRVIARHPADNGDWHGSPSLPGLDLKT
jgi:hypothetical protein